MPGTSEGQWSEEELAGGRHPDVDFALRGVSKAKQMPGQHGSQLSSSLAVSRLPQTARTKRLFQEKLMEAASF